MKEQTCIAPCFCLNQHLKLVRNKHWMQVMWSARKQKWISLTFFEVLDPNASTFITGSKNIERDGVMNDLQIERQREFIHFCTRLTGKEQEHSASDLEGIFVLAGDDGGVVLHDLHTPDPLQIHRTLLDPLLWNTGTREHCGACVWCVFTPCVCHSPRLAAHSTSACSWSAQTLAPYSWAETFASSAESVWSAFPPECVSDSSLNLMDLRKRRTESADGRPSPDPEEL